MTIKKLRTLDQLKCKTFRNIQVDSNNIDNDSRTIEVAFSSETPVERWYGNEILDHTETNIDLEFFRQGAPVLIDHDPSQQIGIVENVRIDKDKVGRAKIRISRSSRAESEWLDIQDGIRRHISVGYAINDVKQEANDNYRVTNWSPFEISFVSIPADKTVGVGRDGFSNQIQTTEPPTK